MLLYSAIGWCLNDNRLVLAANFTTVPAAGVIIVGLTPIMGAMTFASFISE